VVKAAAGNRSRKVMALLLDRRGGEVKRTLEGYDYYGIKNAEAPIPLLRHLSEKSSLFKKRILSPHRFNIIIKLYILTR
jgi:hypothetical protein